MSASALLAPDEPAPVRIVCPDGTSDLVLVVDHAGRAVPRALGDLGVSAVEMERHIAWDIGIAGVTEHLSALLDATAVFQAYSRLVVDCNRPLTAPSLMPVISEQTAIPGNCDLSPAQIQARLAAIYDPYHACIHDVLRVRAAAGRRSIVVAMHSFTPVFHDQPRAMHVGVLFNRDDRLAQALLDVLASQPDLVVAANEPYALGDETDFTIPYHAEAQGLAHVELEIRQDLITDPQAQRAWAQRLAVMLPMACARMDDGDVSRQGTDML